MVFKATADTSIQVPMKNLLLVSGNGQNSGKTTLITQLIHRFSSSVPIIAVKITHHFYDLAYDMKSVHLSNGIAIYEEVNPNQEKDSSRMLKAGAAQVFYIQSDKDRVGEAFQLVREILPSNAAIICESGGLKKYIKPAISILCTAGDGHKSFDSSADLFYDFNKEKMESLLNQIDFDKDGWLIK